MNAATEELVRLLDVEELDKDLYRGRQPETTRDRVYGGQVAAQALVATCRSVPDSFEAHSLHSYFLLPGDYRVPIIYDVERLRDGRSFLTRRVVARQHGRPIYYQTVNFQRPQEGLDHQDRMPEVPGPDQGTDFMDLIRGDSDEEAEQFRREWAGIEASFIGSSRMGLPEDPEHPARGRLWMRIKGDLPDDPVTQLAAFTFASDLSLLSASLAAHDIDPRRMQMASLDHTLWFHRPFRADRWWLYDQWSPSASGARGLSIGRVFTEDGTLGATAAQEGLIRPMRRRD